MAETRKLDSDGERPGPDWVQLARTHRGDGPSGGLPGCLRGVRGRCTTPGKARTPGFDPACNLSRAFPPYRTSLCPEDEAHHRGDCAGNISKPDFHSVTGGCPECDAGGKRDSPVWMYFAMKLKRSRMISSPAEMCGVQRDWLLKFFQYINYFGRVGIVDLGSTPWHRNGFISTDSVLKLAETPSLKPH